MMDRQGKVLDQIQSVLTRPDVYLGTIEVQKSTMYVWENNSPVLRTVKIHSAVYMIIREIISNAIDHVWRSEEKGVPVTKIVITVDVKTGEISVLNDGLSIPVEKSSYDYTDPTTKKKISIKKYPAEVFFGDMFAGTNYDDDNARKTSGKNGIGSTICNILSSNFKVECTDTETGKKFTQTYSNNKKIESKPKITAFSGTVSTTKITFTPDYKYFGVDGISADMESCIAFYAREVAAITGVPVKYNNKLIKIPSFDKFAKMVVPKGKMEYIKAPNGDECVVIESLNQDPDVLMADDISHYSYVNGCRTSKGGIHVKAWRDLIVAPYVRAFNARKGTKTNPINKTSAKNVYPHLYFFVRVNVDRPDFGSGNVKDELVQIYSGKNAKQKVNYTFGESSDWDASIKQVVDKMMKWPMTAAIDDVLSMLSNAKLIKSAAAKKRIAKTGENYADAEDAGNKKTKEGTILNLCEGKSAATLIVTGVGKLPENDRRKYGYIALRGKVINASKATRKKVLKNIEVKLIINLLGLDLTNVSTSELRYSKIRILTDADDDGIHIKGLLYNLFRVIAKDIIIADGFIECHETPVVQLTLKNDKNKLNFYSNEDYAQWISSDENKRKVKGKPRYIKGLGAIDRTEAGGFFLNPMLISNTYSTDQDENAMALAFDTLKKSNGENRRFNWIVGGIGKENKMSFDRVQTIERFVNEKLLVYNMVTLRRGLPCIWDSLKEGQRKIFYAMRKKNYQDYVDLEKTVGAIKELSEYHHGGASLIGAIAGLGFFFVGSHNIKLMDTFGGSGTRLAGGADHAQGRYLQAKHNSICDIVFPKEFDDILEDGDDPTTNPEKKHYIPIIPLILANGSTGIATGASTSIPACNPDTLIEFVEKWLNDDELPTIVPWYHGFKGEIKMNEDGKGWTSSGILKKCTDKNYKGWYEISELPIGSWTESFILKHIEPLVSPKSGTPAILDYNRHGCTDDTVLIRFKPASDFIPSTEHKNNFECLVKKHALTNMTVVNENDVPVKYESLNDIATAFCEYVYPFYKKLRKHRLLSCKSLINKLSNKLIFIKSIVVEKTLDLYQDEDALYSTMEGLGFSKEDGSYESLLKIPTSSLTKKRINALVKEIKTNKERFVQIKSSTPKDLWLAHLQPLKKQWKTEVNNYWENVR